jgi:flavin-dependent dehydrogenase
MSNLKIEKPDLDQVYLGNFSDGGYAYIFPKSKTTANVGTGSMKDINIDERFEEFLEIPEVKVQLKDAKRGIERSGKAPVRPFLEKIVHGNFLFVGDAAFQNFKPFIEGINPAIICGDIAGNISSRYSLKGERLDVYPEIVKRKIGYLFSESDKLTKALYEIFDIKDSRKYLANLAFAINMFSYEDLEKIKGYGYEELKEIIEERSGKRLFSGIGENIESLYVRLRSIIF